MNDEERIREIFKRLNEIYTIRTFHDHDPYKVLVRTILSQRTRDENTDQAANAIQIRLRMHYLMFIQTFMQWLMLQLNMCRN